MNSEILKLNCRTYPKGDCPLDLMGKIAGIDPNVVFCLTATSFWDIFMYLGDNDSNQRNNEEDETLIEIQWLSGRHMTLMINDTRDLFTLTSADTYELQYEYPENPSEIYIIDCE